MFFLKIEDSGFCFLLLFFSGFRISGFRFYLPVSGFCVLVLPQRKSSFDFSIFATSLTFYICEAKCELGQFYGGCSLQAAFQRKEKQSVGRLYLSY